MNCKTDVYHWFCWATLKIINISAFSRWSFYMETVIPEILFSNRDSLAIVGTGALSYDIFPGTFTVDDVYTTSPYGNFWLILEKNLGAHRKRVKLIVVFFCKGEVLYSGKNQSCCLIIVWVYVHMLWQANLGFLVSISSSFSLSSMGEVTFAACRTVVHECLPTSVPGCRRPWAWDIFKGGFWDLSNFNVEFKPFWWDFFWGLTG